MQVLGFNFTKILAEKISKVTKPPVTNIEFIGMEKERVDFLKETEAVKVSFKYDLIYESERKEEDSKERTREGNVLFEGNVIISLNKDELKEITKSWKKKSLPEDVKIPIFNLILRRCTPKAVQLQDEINLPFHVPMPRVGRN